MRFELLVDHTWAIPTVARWYFDDKGYQIPTNTYEETINRIHGKLNRDYPPLHVIAIQDQEIRGVAQLKKHELTQFPAYEYWLGSVYVDPDYRGQHIAHSLCNEVINVARKIDAKEIYLSTERIDGGLYRHIGFEPVLETVDRGDNVLIMKRSIQKI